ncbi:MAG: hypothetical protein IT377_33590 [Polyangiaceae bacterium]|nr:hypothetical protein [Polyangiaceae bacterium]
MSVTSWSTLLVLACVACACSDSGRPKPKPSCSGVHHAELVLSGQLEPEGPAIPFSYAEFQADRTVRFRNYCEIMAGGTPTTKCKEEPGGPPRYTISYSDAARIDWVTLRVFDRHEQLRYEETQPSADGLNIFDDCPEDTAYFVVPFVLDPPGIPPDGGADAAADDAGGEGGTDAASD